MVPTTGQPMQTRPFTAVQIGDVLSHEPGQTLVCAPRSEPCWIILRVPSGGEREAARWLRDFAAGAISETWWPVERGWQVNPATGRKRPFSRPAVPGYVYARLVCDLHWHILRDRMGSRCLGAVGQSDRGILGFTDADLAEMEEFAERLDEANREASRSEADRFPVKAGGLGRFLSGPMQGVALPVVEVSGDDVWLLLGALRTHARKQDMRAIDGTEASE